MRSLVVTLLDLKNAFGGVHHNLIPVVLDFHHVPPELIECIMSLYKDFATTVIRDFIVKMQNICNLTG